jgi:multiple sugar transport system substrate-binding protein
MRAVPSPAGPSRRSFLGASLLVVGGAVLPACSTNPQQPSGGAAKITLQQWYHAYGEPGTQEAVKRYAAQYTKANPDVAIKITWVAGEYETKLNSALLGGSAPDLFEIGDFRRQLVANGHVAPVDDVLRPFRSQFSKAALDTASVDGKTYGIKMFDDLMMLYYRRSVLDKAGVTPPQTFDELVEAAKTLTNKGRKGLFIGNDGLGDAPYLLLWSNGGELVSNRRVTFADTKGVEALAGLRDLHKSKALLTGFTTDWYDAAAIVQNAAAMHWCGLWAMPGITKELGDDFGVIPWPRFGSEGSPVARVGGWYQLVNQRSKHVEEAKKYAAWLWLQQDKIAEDWAVNYGFHVPARAKVANATKKLSDGPARATVEIGQDHGKSFPNTWNTATSTAFAEAATKVVRSGADPRKALGDAAEICQSEIDRQYS